MSNTEPTRNESDPQPAQPQKSNPVPAGQTPEERLQSSPRKRRRDDVAPEKDESKVLGHHE